jgi:hypothetical protein
MVIEDVVNDRHGGLRRWHREMADVVESRGGVLGDLCVLLEACRLRRPRHRGVLQRIGRNHRRNNLDDSDAEGR